MLDAAFIPITILVILRCKAICERILGVGAAWLGLGDPNKNLFARASPGAKQRAIRHMVTILASLNKKLDHNMIILYSFKFYILCLFTLQLKFT